MFAMLIQHNNFQPFSVQASKNFLAETQASL